MGNGETCDQLQESSLLCETVLLILLVVVVLLLWLSVSHFLLGKMVFGWLVVVRAGLEHCSDIAELG